jgi:hypothetical protein
MRWVVILASVYRKVAVQYIAKRRQVQRLREPRRRLLHGRLRELLPLAFGVA